MTEGQEKTEVRERAVWERAEVYVSTEGHEKTEVRERTEDEQFRKEQKFVREQKKSSLGENRSSL